MAEKENIFEGVDTSVLSHHAQITMTGDTLQLRDVSSVTVAFVQLLCALKKDYYINIELFADNQITKLLINTGFNEIFIVNTQEEKN